MPYREEAITSLIHILNEGNEADRCYAARSLGALQASSAAAALINRLRDEDLDVCIDAATALGQIATPEATRSLLEALENEPDGEVKATIATSLGNFNDPEVRDALNQIAVCRPDNLIDDAADWDSYWDIQLEAIKALTKLGGTDKADEIAALIDDEECQDIEAEILKVLACSGEPGFRHLATKLSAPFPRTRRRAVQALRYQDSEPSRQALSAALKDDEGDVRLSALASIGYLQATELFSEVVALISDDTPQVRQEVLNVLSTFGLAGGKSILTTEHLFPLLADKSSDVRITLLRLIEKQVQQQGTELSTEELATIRALTASEDADEASIACKIIAEANDREAVDRLIGILESGEKDEMLRKEATVSLGKLGLTTPAVMRALQQHIVGESRVIRLAALQALLDLENATQDTQVVTLSENELEEPAPSDPMALLIASLYGDLGALSEQQNATPEAVSDSDDLERIDAVIIESVSEDNQEEQEDDRPSAAQFVDAAQSTLASLHADQPIIPDGYPTDYRELDNAEERTVNSTLEAVTQENVEATLLDDRPVEPHVQSIMKMIDELPEELSEFGKTVKANNAVAEQMIDQSRKTSLKNDVRHLAVRALSAIDVAAEKFSDAQREKIDRVIEGLILALADQDDQLRCEAADAIYQLATKNPKTPGLVNAFGGLVTQLQFGTPEFRVRAVKALGPLEHKAAIPPLLECLADEEVNVRIHAIYSLARLLNSRWSEQKASHHMVLEDVTAENVTQRLVEMLDDPSNGVRKAAIDVLTDRQYQAAVDKMITIALENEGAMAPVVGQALRKMNASEAASLVTGRLKETESSSARRFLITIIEEMFKPDAVARKVG